MIIVPIKEGENIERALKKFKRKFEKTGAIRELYRWHMADEKKQPGRKDNQRLPTNLLTLTYQQY